MTRKVFVLAAFIALLCPVVAAQDIGGRYKSEGTDPAGGHFSLTAEIEMLPENTCRIKWSDGSSGICFLTGTTFSIAYIIHGAVGLGVYEVSSDGTIEGPFIDDFHGGGIGTGGKIGTEKLTPIR
jgi:hypothetical protein